MRVAQLLRQQGATNINSKQNLTGRTIGENSSIFVQGRPSLTQKCHLVLSDKAERQVIVKVCHYGASRLVAEFSNVQNDRSFFSQRCRSRLQNMARENHCVNITSPRECTDTRLCRPHRLVHDLRNGSYVKSGQGYQKINISNSVYDKGGIGSPGKIRCFLQNSSDFWISSFLSSPCRSYSGIAWFSKQNFCVRCGRVKGGNSSLNRRYLSSPPLTTVTNSSQTASKSPGDDIGRPWTTLQARDYGKSIPVLQEPVTVTPADIKKYLTAQNIKFDNGHTCFITSCPRLNKRKVKLEETDKMYINMTTGMYSELNIKAFGYL